MNKTINSHQPRTARRALLGVALSLVLAQGALMPTSFANPVDLSLQAKSLQQGLHQLSNQDLLTQASQSYQQALAQFNAERRLLLQHQSLYQQTQAANADWQMPEPLAPIGLEVDEAVLARAEAHIQSYQAREQSLLQERTILENYLRQYDASLQATEHFLATLQELQVAILELSLRIQDGSLQPGQRPLYLTQAAITQRARALETEQAALQERQAQSRQQLQNLQQNLETIQASLASTQTQLTQMRNQLEEQNRQHALQENYRKQDNQALAESFAKLEDERVFLQGDFQLLLLRFNQGYEQLTPLAQALEAPVDTIEASGTGLGVAELETQIAALQTQIEALEQRLQELQPYQQQQEKFVEQGEAFKMGASFLQKQLAQMQMLIRIAAERQLPLAQELDQATLEDQRARIDQQVQEANAKLEVAQTQVLALKTRLEEIKSAHQQANQLLADLQQSLASSKQAQQWEQEVLSLDSQALIDHFVKGVQAVGDQQAALQAQQQDVTQAQADIRALIDQTASLSDPLIKRPHPQVQQEAQRIQRQLYELAGLKLEEAKTSDTTSEAPASTQLPQFSGDLQGLQDYQSLAASRQQYLNSQAQNQAQIVSQLQALEELQTIYVQGISDLHLLSLQQYATAMELKKQLGRGELPAEQAPEGLLQALRKEPLRTLEQTLSEAINQRAHTRFRIISLGGQTAEERAQQEAQAAEAAKAAEEGAASEDPAASAPTSTASTTEEATPATPTQAEALAPLQALVGQRLDLLADLDRLEAERLQQEATLTGSERLEQQAENRMREGSGWLEAILSVLPSDRAAELTELLRGNYQKLLIVEAQQALLATEKEKVAQLIQLTQEDRQASAQALPLLKAQLQALTLQQDTLWVSAQAQLQPQKADQLKADFSVRTGISLPSAPPLLEKNKADFIARVQDELLTLYVQKLALQQWIPVLEQRQASTLLNEIAHYRDHEGQLNALDASFMRMVKRLTGHTQEELAQLPERQQPSTHLETIYFLEGEIGADHEQRSQALLRALLRFVFELFAIIYGTWFLIMMAKRFVNRRSQEIEMRAGPESTHQLFVLSFSFVAFRLVVVLLAATLALSRMGFDIGVIVASLGIGGFAVALAAKETLSDLIGGITLFVEHSFSIGDVIQISSSDPKMGAAEVGRVEAVSWRVTRITNVMNYSITIPNGRVSESVIINYTRQAQLRDFTHVYISPAYSTRQVVALINEAVDECNLIRQDLQKQVLATGNTVIDKVLVSRYEIRWYTDIPYLARARVLTELWTRLWQKFHEAGLSLEYGLPQEVQAPALPAQAKTLPQQPPTHSA